MAVHKQNVDTEKPWITTYRGHFDFHSVDQVRAADICHHLANQSRYNGETIRPYSIAQHSVVCCLEAKARGLSEDVQYAALMHDAAEAYIGDIARPVRRKISGFDELEEQTMRLIRERFDVPEAEEVRDIDNTVYAYERRGIARHDLIDVSDVEEPDPAVAKVLSSFWTELEAKRRFAEEWSRFYDLPDLLID